ncbi:MAG: hypothetical protein KatS3mg013_0396 [Actinomycetota bacterium]|nr:MAG: hypothetical protein KatS3mg013_0396 [Actinomycetota bacterium]
MYDPRVAGPLQRLTAPPYDVISEPVRAALAAASPYNVIRIDLAEGPADPNDPGNRYRHAAETLRSWRANGVLVPTGGPCIVAYELRFRLEGRDRSVRGLIAALELEPWGGSILPHEETMPGPVEDRLQLLRATQTHLSPVYLTAAAHPPELAALLDEATAQPPSAEVRDEEGVVHRVWIVPADEPVQLLHEAAPLLIADGHHRYATALAYREERRATDGPGPWDRILAFVADAESQQIPVLAYHRLQLAGAVPELPGRPVDRLEDALAALDDDAVRIASAVRVDGRVRYRVHELPGEPPAVRALHAEVLDRVAPGGRLRFTHDAREADAAVRGGSAVAAYLLPPTSPRTIRRVVERGQRLPRKSTFFWPKPRSGVVLLPLGSDPAPVRTRPLTHPGGRGEPPVRAPGSRAS